MKLNVKERLLIIGILPQEGSLSEMVDVYDLVRELKLSSEEKAEISYVESGNYIKWDNEKDKDKDINISEDQLSIIKKEIDSLDKKGKISLELIPIIQKINGSV